MGPVPHLSLHLPARSRCLQVAVMHGDLPLVQRLVAEVGGVSADMLEQLLQRLQGAVQLPECLRIIGYLRRLAAFPGESLGLSGCGCECVGCGLCRCAEGDRLGCCGEATSQQHSKHRRPDAATRLFVGGRES